jgi:UDP-N-acetylmuramate--alanine ligase
MAPSRWLIWSKTWRGIIAMPSAPDSLRAAEQLLAMRGSSIHMTGIGGVGMAGLAVLLRGRGHRVNGCDASDGPLLAWLREQGIDCAVGHTPAHVHTTNPLHGVIRSPAVALDEPELMAARDRGIPVLDRGVVLPVLLRERCTAAVAGTHGKTTTASMLAWWMRSAGQPVAYCIGGIAPNLGAVACAEGDDRIVVEADESDGTLQYYTPDLAVITNMDPDHVDYFHDTNAQAAVFATFAARARQVIVPAGDADVARVIAGHPAVCSFGWTPEATFYADAIECRADSSSFDVVERGKRLGRIELGVSGRHNILNALAATAAALAWGLSFDAIVKAAPAFRLPRRRFEEVAAGRGITVISDYAHHPAEIDALIRQARLRSPRRIIGVFQPHRYSRTRAFKKEFARSLSSLDYLVLAPVYAASEPWIAGGTTEDLYAVMRDDAGARVVLADSLESAWDQLRDEAQADDLVLVIGAGDVEKIGAWAARAWSE